MKQSPHTDSQHYETVTMLAKTISLLSMIYEDDWFAALSRAQKGHFL